MIIVRNTKELEQKWDLNKLPDTEKIMVLGGFEGKPKYLDCPNLNKREEYLARITYSTRQIKQIIAEMKEIEESIPLDWNKWQRAKYIYETLAENIKYNYNQADYNMNYNSNLAILLARKGICAGYSLLYKEMMDRQGITCDYVRGRTLTNTRKLAKHAWNVLTIDGKSFGVDVTWESAAKHDGEKELSYFGNNTSFLEKHSADEDEIQYDIQIISKDSIKAIPSEREEYKYEISDKEKKDIINYAILKTYQDVRDIHSEQEARRNVRKAIRDYIKEGRIDGLTSDKHVRNRFTQNITQKEIQTLLIDDYREGLEQGNRVDYNDDIIRNEGDILLEQQQDLIIQAILEREIEKEEKNKSMRYKETEMQKQYFTVDELEEVDFPKEKTLISKAISWLRMKTKQQLFGRNKQSITRTKSRETKLKDDQRE